MQDELTMRSERPNTTTCSVPGAHVVVAVVAGVALLAVAIASTRAGGRELHPVGASDTPREAVGAAIFGVGVGAWQWLWFREGTTAGRRAIGMPACAAASNENETDEELDEWCAAVGVVGVGRGGALFATLVAVTEGAVCSCALGTRPLRRSE